MPHLEDRPGQVQAWIVRVGSRPSGWPVDEVAGWLSAVECARADRFRDASSRERFLTGRIHLRFLLGALLDEVPERVPIVNGPAGKPRLGPGLDAPPPLHFSVAHSGEYVSIALSASAPVGIDIEAIRPFDGMEAVARRVMTEGERRVLELLPAKRRGEAFFGTWTRKEAVLKTIGTGFGFPPERVDVGAGPRAVTVVLDASETGAVGGDAGTGDRSGANGAAPWTVETLPAFPRGYQAAVAVAGPSIRIRIEADFPLPARPGA